MRTTTKGRQEQLNTKYLVDEEKDVNYLSTGYLNNKSNRHSICSKYGFYFEYRKCREIINILRNLEIRDMKILDVGCGRGLHTNLFANLKGTSKGITGIDISKKYIDYAKGINPGIDYKVKNLYDSGLDDDFDLVSFIYVFNGIRFERFKIIKKLTSKCKYVLVMDLKYRKNPPGNSCEWCFDDNIIKKDFPGFEIVESKKFMNRYSFFLSKHFSYPMMELTDKIIPSKYYICLLKRI